MTLIPYMQLKTKSGKTITNITGLYSLLLETGWSKETCANKSVWNEENPTVGQSLVTALLVQKCFGGEVHYFTLSKRTHHFNFINGCYIDLTFEELDPSLRVNYPPEKSINLGFNPKNSYAKNYDKLKALVENCGFTTIKLTPPPTKRKAIISHKTRRKS